MSAIEKYKSSEASLEKAAGLAGVSVSKMMDILKDYGIEANLDYEDYLKNLKIHKGGVVRADCLVAIIEVKFGRSLKLKRGLWMAGKRGKEEKNISIEEAKRYLDNAREILKGVPVEDDTYLDVKPVREAFGVAYLAILEAINAVLIEKGVDPKRLPKSVDGYRTALRKYLAVHDGKLLREFEMLYDLLHIAGYYRALLYNPQIVKDSLKLAEKFIKRLEKGPLYRS